MFLQKFVPAVKQGHVRDELKDVRTISAARLRIVIFPNFSALVADLQVLRAVAGLG